MNTIRGSTIEALEAIESSRGDRGSVSVSVSVSVTDIITYMMRVLQERLCPPHSGC